MRIILLCLLSFCTIGLMGQAEFIDASNKDNAGSFLNKFSIMTTAGTPSLTTGELKNVTLKRLSELSLGQLTISYKMNSRMSFGISTMGNLSSAKAGYFNAENQFFSFCEDDDDEDELEIDEDDDLEMDEDMDDDHDEDCDEDEIGQNILGTITYKLSDKLPFFVQAGGGYTFGSKAPAYTAMVGYNQKLFTGFGVMAGVRFSDVLHQKPAEAIRTQSGAGLKAELGLSWNF